MTTTNLREEVPINIVKWADLETAMNDLFSNFWAWEEKNAKLIDKFADQPFFRWEESLINKLVEVKPDITFDHIKQEWINLALLQYDNWIWDFKGHLDKINHNEIKHAFMNEVFNKVQNKIWTWAPYTDFSTECAVPWDTNVISYFQKVIDYLKWKETATHWKKVINILKDLVITNESLNSLLPTWEQIPTWISLMDTTIPENTRNDFDVLLSFEIGKEVDRTINISKNISKKLESLFTNSFPAINTIVWENDLYKYDESKLWDEYEWKLQIIKDDTNLSEDGKTKQINDLRWEFYLKYLKRKNKKIGDALQQLHDNNFDYSKLDSDVLKNYIDKIVDIRLKMLFDSWLNNVIKIDWWNIDEFSKFYKELADPSKYKIQLGAWVNLKVEKSIDWWEHPWLNDITQFWDIAKTYDNLPITYTIRKDDIDSLPLEIDDRIKLLNFLSRFKTDEEKYIIQWWEIWMLIYLFFVVNSRFPLTQFDPEKQKDIENLFWQAKNHNENWWDIDEEEKEKNEEESVENNMEQKEWIESFTLDKFKEKIETLWPWKFEDWSEVWLPMWNSELPWWGYQWMKVKISNINMKKWEFTGTVFWWELKFNNKLEWRSRKFSMNEETLDIFNKISKDWNKVWLLPNPNKSDFNSFRRTLNDKLWTSKLSFPCEWVTWDNGKFMQKLTDEKWKEKRVEIKYFWASWDNKSTYRIEYNPIKRSFTVSSAFNWDEKWKDWKTQKKRFSYRRDMDWNNFLIFFTQKWLSPQTENQAKDVIQRQDNEFKMVNGGHRKLNWFSLNSIKNVFKTIKWNIKKKIDDYNKAQDQELEDILIGDWWIYSKLANILWFIPSIKGWLWELEQEYYNERDNRTWKKIEYYLKKFQADPDFGTTFDQVPPHAKIQWWRSLQKIITDRVANAQDRMWDPELYQAAALLLANFEKWGSPYRWLATEENKWLRVKALLWKAHYQQFMRDKAKLIKARDDAENWGPWDKKWLNETLAACEMKYIINNIRWSYRWLIVWSYEDRWIPWEENTDYIDNPSKRLLSDQFANKLESAYKWRFNKWTVDEKYNKFKSNNSFDEMENEFGKSSSTRYQTWEAALRRMIDLASNNDLKKRMKRHFLTYLLSWALDVNCDPWLKKQVYGWAKPMMFVPWLLVKDAGVAENIATLLDDIEPKWDFSKKVSTYFHRSKQLDWWVNFKKLQKDLNKRLTDEKMDQLDEYFAKLPTKDISGYPEPKRSILERYQKAMSDSNRDEWDRWILDNPKVVSNGLLSSVEVVQKRMNINNRWEFNGKDIDEIKNMKEFRENVTKDINNRTTEPREVAFVLEKFFSRFWIDNQKIYERVRTADYRDKNRWQFLLPYKGVELNMWNIGDKEIDSILWYAFQWNAWKSRGLWCDTLPDELFSTLKAFQTYFEKAFHNKTLLDDYVVKNAFQPKTTDTTALLIWSRSIYDETFSWDSEFQFMDSSVNDDDLSSGDKDKARKAKKNKRKELLRSTVFINSDIANIEKQLKRNLGWTSRLFPQITSSNSRTLRENYLRWKLTA